MGKHARGGQANLQEGDRQPNDHRDHARRDPAPEHHPGQRPHREGVHDRGDESHGGRRDRRQPERSVRNPGTARPTIAAGRTGSTIPAWEPRTTPA